MRREQADGWGWAVAIVVGALIIAATLVVGLTLYQNKEEKAKHNTHWHLVLATVERVGTYDYGDVPVQVVYYDLQGHPQRTIFDFQDNNHHPRVGSNLKAYISDLKKDQKQTHIYFDGARLYPIENPFKVRDTDQYYPVWSSFAGVIIGIILAVLAGCGVAEYLRNNGWPSYKRRSQSLYGMKTKGASERVLVHKADGSLREETRWK